MLKAVHEGRQLYITSDFDHATSQARGRSAEACGWRTTPGGRSRKRRAAASGARTPGPGRAARSPPRRQGAPQGRATARPTPINNNPYQTNSQTHRPAGGAHRAKVRCGSARMRSRTHKCTHVCPHTVVKGLKSAFQSENFPRCS